MGRASWRKVGRFVSAPVAIGGGVLTGLEHIDFVRAHFGDVLAAAPLVSIVVPLVAAVAGAVSLLLWWWDVVVTRRDRPDWPIHELFSRVEPALRASGSDPFGSPTGNIIKDWLSTGQLRSWGRLSNNGTLVEIPADYWRHASWTYFFLYEEERRDMAHVRRSVGDHSDAPAYWDVRVNKAEGIEVR